MKAFFATLFRNMKAQTKTERPGSINPCVNHDWKHIGTTRHFWNLHPDGTSSGMYSDLPRLMESYSTLSTVREQFSKLMEWRVQGFNACHTSWNHYKCTACGKTCREEFYTHPHKKTPPTAKDKEAFDRVIKMVT